MKFSRIAQMKRKMSSLLSFFGQILEIYLLTLLYIFATNFKTLIQTDSDTITAVALHLHAFS